MFAPQAPGIFGALAHTFATLQHDGFEAHLRQQQGGKYAARTKAHHHRAQRQRGGRVANRLVVHVGGGANVRMVFEPGQQQGFLGGVGQRQVHNKHRQQFGLARVKAAFENLQLGNSVYRKAQGLGRHLAQGLHRVGWWGAVGLGFGGRVDCAAAVYRQGRQGKFEFCKTNH